jgi:hypothetical protein
MMLCAKESSNVCYHNCLRVARPIDEAIDYLNTRYFLVIFPSTLITPNVLLTEDVRDKGKLRCEKTILSKRERHLAQYLKWKIGFPGNLALAIAASIMQQQEEQSEKVREVTQQKCKQPRF